MPLTVVEAEAAARALRGWPAGQRAYALAWAYDGVNYHRASSLLRDLRDGECALSQLGPAATVALMRLPSGFSGQAFKHELQQAFADLRVALDLTPQEWVEALGDPPTLASTLEDYASRLRAYLRGEVLYQEPTCAPALEDRSIVALSTTARQALRVLNSDPKARLLYDRVAKAWFVRNLSSKFNFRVREPTASWLVSEELVGLETTSSEPSGVTCEDAGLRYVISDLGRRCLAAEEAGLTA